MKSKIYCILFAILATAVTVGVVCGMAYLVSYNPYICTVAGFTGALFVLWFEFCKCSSKDNNN